MLEAIHHLETHTYVYCQCLGQYINLDMFEIFLARPATPYPVKHLTWIIILNYHSRAVAGMFFHQLLNKHKIIQTLVMLRVYVSVCVCSFELFTS
jgi:hypothetical protein